MATTRENIDQNRMPHAIVIRDTTLILLPEGAIYLPDHEALLLADLHLGKAAHFRKNGIPIPPQADEANWLQLARVLDKYPACHVFFLGDLFHSEYNTDWDHMQDLTDHYSGHRFTLVRGNHDILVGEQYISSGISEIVEEANIGPFLLTHHPLNEFPGDSYNLAGHVHPGISVKGRGRQRVKLSCFYFEDASGILPAFGQFKGRFLLSPVRGARIFAITGEEVIDVSANF